MISKPFKFNKSMLGIEKIYANTLPPAKKRALIASWRDSPNVIVKYLHLANNEVSITVVTTESDIRKIAAGVRLAQVFERRHAFTKINAHPMRFAACQSSQSPPSFAEAYAVILHTTQNSVHTGATYLELSKYFQAEDFGVEGNGLHRWLTRISQIFQNIDLLDDPAAKKDLCKAITEHDEHLQALRLKNGAKKRASHTLFPELPQAGIDVINSLKKFPKTLQRLLKNNINQLSRIEQRSFGEWYSTFINYGGDAFSFYTFSLQDKGLVVLSTNSMIVKSHTLSGTITFLETQISSQLYLTNYKVTDGYPKFITSKNKDLLVVFYASFDLENSDLPVISMTAIDLVKMKVLRTGVEFFGVHLSSFTVCALSDQLEDIMTAAVQNEMLHVTLLTKATNSLDCAYKPWNLVTERCQVTNLQKLKIAISGYLRDDSCYFLLNHTSGLLMSVEQHESAVSKIVAEDQLTTRLLIRHLTDDPSSPEPIIKIFSVTRSLSDQDSFPRLIPTAKGFVIAWWEIGDLRISRPTMKDWMQRIASTGCIPSKSHGLKNANRLLPADSQFTNLEVITKTVVRTETVVKVYRLLLTAQDRDRYEKS